MSDNWTRDGVVRVRRARTRSCLRLHKRRSIKHSELRKSCGFLIGLYFGLYLDKSQSILIYAPDAALSESYNSKYGSMGPSRERWTTFANGPTATAERRSWYVQASDPSGARTNAV